MGILGRIVAGLLLALSLSGCGLSQDEIARNVKSSMQQTLNESPNFKDYGLRVKDVQVAKKGGNSYKGMATVIYKESAHNVSIDIVVDGRSVIWEAPPGAFLFIAQAELENLQTDLQMELDKFQKNLQKELQNLEESQRRW